MYTEEEVQTLITTAKYKYYEDYVKPLEIAHDELLDNVKKAEKEIKKLKEKNKLLKMEVTRKANKIKALGVNVSQQDFARLRKQTVKIKEKLDDSYLIIEKLRKELAEKNKLLRGGR